MIKSFWGDKFYVERSVKDNFPVSTRREPQHRCSVTRMQEAHSLGWPFHAPIGSLSRMVRFRERRGFKSHFLLYRFSKDRNEASPRLFPEAKKQYRLISN